MANTGFIINTQQKKEVLSISYPTLVDFPSTGDPTKYYKALDTTSVYQWVIDSYEEIDPALDENGDFCIISGLPQATRPISPSPNPPYRELNTGSCPVDPSSSVLLTGETVFNVSKFTVTATLAEALSVDIVAVIKYEWIEDGIPYLNSVNIPIPNGDTTASVDVSYTPSGSISSVLSSVQNVTPNPAGTKTIVY